MRRLLVLTREGARHPFRASFPALVNFRLKTLSAPHRTALLTKEDIRGFANTYIAGVVAVLAFIM